MMVCWLTCKINAVWRVNAGENIRTDSDKKQQPGQSYRSILQSGTLSITRICKPDSHVSDYEEKEMITNKFRPPFDDCAEKVQITSPGSQTESDAESCGSLAFAGFFLALRQPTATFR